MAACRANRRSACRPEDGYHARGRGGSSAGVTTWWRRMRKLAVLAVVWAVLFLPGIASAAQPADQVLRVGSKRFTESYILGEILAQTAAPVARAEHRQGLGNTAIVLSALRTGA